MRTRFSKATMVKVLIFTVVSIIFTVGLGLKIGNLRLFSDEYRLEAQFADAGGIFKGDAVKLAGVDVGRVLGAKIEKGRAIVEFTVQKDVKLPRADSLVGMRWRNVLGQRFLYIYPGQGTQPVLHNTAAQGDRRTGYYEEGDRIPESQTVEAGDLNEFLNSLGPILRSIDPDKANAFLDAMNQALGGNEIVVRQLLDQGGVFASRLGEMDEQIKTFISSSDVVVTTYANQSEALDQVLEHLDVLGGSLESMVGDIESLVVNFADVQQLLDRLLKRNRSNIDVSLRSLNTVLGTLARHRTQLEHTLCTLPAGISPYFQTTSWGEWFNVRITAVVLKAPTGPRDSVIVGVVPEDENQREGEAVPPYVGCGRFEQYIGGGPPTANGGGGGGGGDDDDNGDASAIGASALPGSFEAFMGSVIGG
jgi:phospholipid/cholesterol/gamma-HCH transport system substrate-binding protein